MARSRDWNECHSVVGFFPEKSKRSEHELASWFGDSIDCSSPLPSGCFQWWHWQNSLMILSLTHYSLPQLCHTLTILIENSELCRQSNVGEGWVIHPSIHPFMVLFHKRMDWWKVKIHPPTHFHGWKARMSHSSIHLFIHLSICRLSGYLDEARTRLKGIDSRGTFGGDGAMNIAPAPLPDWLGWRPNLPSPSSSFLPNYFFLTFFKIHESYTL